MAASIKSFRPPPCDFGGEDCHSATELQNAFLFGAISLIAIGTGGIKPCISTFGADQFDQADPKEIMKKYSFFNWFFFAINFGTMLGITLVSYIEDRNNWGWGFGISAAANVASVLTLVAGTRFYRHQNPSGSPLTRFLQVLVAACRNYAKGVEGKSEEELFEVSTVESTKRLPHTERYIFLDKAAVASGEPNAAVSRWRLCTVTQVEEFKSFIKVLPICATTIAFPFAFAQISFFISQGMVMDRRLSDHFVVPPGSVAIFATVNALLFIPLYERFVIPFFRHFTRQPRGLSSLQRVGIGLFITIPTFAIAAFVERHRRSSAEKSITLTFWWLLPQYFLLGIAEVFTYVGQLEFFYDEATDGTRSLSSATFMSGIGVGNWLSMLLVKIVERSTGWLTSDLNGSELDYYYWIVCGINSVNFLVFYVVVARFYKGNVVASRNNRAEVESNGSTTLGGEA